MPVIDPALGHRKLSLSRLVEKRRHALSRQEAKLVIKRRKLQDIDMTLLYWLVLLHFFFWDFLKSS